MPIEIKIKNTNSEERIDIRIVKNPEFQALELRQEIFRRVKAIKLS